MAMAPMRKAPPVQGIRRSSPPKPIEFQPVHRPVDRSGAQKEQALEHRVIEHVQQRGGERECRPSRLAAVPEQQRRAQSEHDDADVLDGVESEQPLEFVLEERVDDAAQCRERAQRESSRATQTGDGSHSNSTRISP